MVSDNSISGRNINYDNTIITIYIPDVCETDQPQLDMTRVALESTRQGLGLATPDYASTVMIERMGVSIDSIYLRSGGIYYLWCEAD